MRLDWRLSNWGLMWLDWGIANVLCGLIAGMLGGWLVYILCC